jgi:ElaB/YqjD/DUF883 family membrane-anchored ribosome-binding protein
MEDENMTADDLARLLDELQRRLDGPARYAFDLVVRQVVIESVVALATCLLVLSLCASVAYVTYRILKTNHSFSVLRYQTALKAHEDKEAAGEGYSAYWKFDYVDPPDPFSALAIGGALAIILGLIALFAVGFGATAVIHLLNPEYAALERVIQLIVGTAR